MPGQRKCENIMSCRETNEHSRRRVMPAGKVGVTLTISARALKDLQRMQEQAVKAALESPELYWR